MIQVTIARLGQPATTISVPEGSTVEATLEAASVSTNGTELRLNNQVVDPATPVTAGDILTLVSQIKGG